MKRIPASILLLVSLLVACNPQVELITSESTAMAPTFTAPPDGTSRVTSAPTPDHTPTSAVSQATLTASPVMIGPEEQDCQNVISLQPTSAGVQAVLSALLQYHRETNIVELLPDTPFKIAEVRSIVQQGDWVLVQASFSAYLEPGIFLLKRTSQGFEYDRLLWGGQADSATELRLRLIEENPEVPQDMLACFEVAGWFVARDEN